jgi:hypothetical protein
MRRTLVGLGIAAVVCAIAAASAALVTVRLLQASGIYGGSYSDTGPTPEQQSIASLGWTLSLTTAPLAGGALLAVVAILLLLAMRRQLRVATQAPAPSDTADRPAAGTP